MVPKDAFLGKLKGVLGSRPLPTPYYPGVHGRYASFQKEYPEAEQVTSKIHNPNTDLNSDPSFNRKPDCRSRARSLIRRHIPNSASI